MFKEIFKISDISSVCGGAIKVIGENKGTNEIGDNVRIGNEILYQRNVQEDMSSSGTSSSTMNLPLKDSSSVDGMSDMMLPAVWSPDYAALVLLMW